MVRSITDEDIARVKDELPKLAVSFNGQTYDGEVYGRKERFAKVVIYPWGKRSDFIEREYSWEAVTRAHKYGSALVF